MKRVFISLAVLSLAISGRTLAYSSQKSQQAPTKQDQQTGHPAQNAPGGQAAAAPQVTKAESEALKAIQNELDPDRAIQMVNDFIKKYPESVGLPFAYLRGADSYRQKGDVQHVIEYSEKSLKLKGDNPVALLMVASLLPEPQSLQGASDLERDKKLTQAEEYANRAIKLVDQLSKQPNVTDDQFQKNKASLTSWAHSSLGMVHLERAEAGLTGLDPDELSKAEKEYQAAVSVTDSPSPSDYYRLAEALKGGGKTAEAIAAFNKASELDQSGVIKPLADKEIEQMQKQKAAQKPAAKP